MPLGSPIGTGKGIRTKEFIEMIVEEIKEDPYLQAKAFRWAVQAGRASYLAKGNYTKFLALNPK